MICRNVYDLSPKKFHTVISNGSLITDTKRFFAVAMLVFYLGRELCASRRSVTTRNC